MTTQHERRAAKALKRSRRNSPPHKVKVRARSLVSSISAEQRDLTNRIMARAKRASELSLRSRDELRALAKEANLAGRGSMTKEQLVEALAAVSQ